MKMTHYSRKVMEIRRQRRDLLRNGYEEISARSAGKLWELDRGWRHDHVITDVILGKDGKTIFFKTAPGEWLKISSNARALFPARQAA